MALRANCPQVLLLPESFELYWFTSLIKPSVSQLKILERTLLTLNSFLHESITVDMYSPRGCNSVCLSPDLRTSLALHNVYGQLHSLFGQHTYKDNHYWQIVLNQRHICQWVVLQADGVLRQRSDPPHSSFGWGNSTNQNFWYQS